MVARLALFSLAIAFTALAGRAASAAEIKVLTAGAFKAVLVALAPEFEKDGHKLVIENDTAGGLVRRVEGGEAFDVAIITPSAIDELIAKGKVAPGTRVNLAKVGIGVMVKEGAAKPDISSVKGFQDALLAAKSISYVDPASGGSSGIYLAGLFEKLGIADALKNKTRLKKGGLVADLVTGGEAELGMQQVSEIIPVKGVTLVGLLPAEVQSYTTYAAGIGANAKDSGAAQALVKFLSGPQAKTVLAAKGMEPGSAP